MGERLRAAREVPGAGRAVAGRAAGPEPQPVERMGERLRAAREVPGVGIEVVVVEGQGDAVVAGLRDKGEGVVEAVVRGAVGIVGEPGGALARARASAGGGGAG